MDANIAAENITTVEQALENVKRRGRPRTKPVVVPTAEELAAKEAEKAEKKAAREEKKAALLAEREVRRAEKAAKRQEKLARREAEKAEKAAERDAKKAFAVGQAVKVVGGDFSGVQGVVSKCARKRVFIAVEGQKKPAYCFVTDVVAL